MGQRGLVNACVSGVPDLHVEQVIKRCIVEGTTALERMGCVFVFIHTGQVKRKKARRERGKLQWKVLKSWRRTLNTRNLVEPLENILMKTLLKMETVHQQKHEQDRREVEERMSRQIRGRIFVYNSFNCIKFKFA